MTTSLIWEGDRHLRRELADSVIYEMHVRGFTQHESSGVDKPGTYLGVIEKIPYLKSLGVTAVELMPVHEFPINDIHGDKPERGNYWGYDPMAFFSPHRGYQHSDEPGGQVREFKQMVKELHRAGIEVILDVVVLTTPARATSWVRSSAFKGLENHVYYMLANGGSRYANYSGCGNTVNGNHPIVREMIFHCLRHWVHNYHIDGFRFDLASILSRDRNGNLMPNPPLVEAIAADPMLADTKIIAEAWDAAGAYQVGSFGQVNEEKRWAEWNGRYRDDIRGFWRGDAGTIGAFATRLSGSADLYEHAGRPPYCSINFITSHDGFTLADLVTYRDKHNEANGEGNRDGDNHNTSDNYGVEGPTNQSSINEVRRRQVKNMFASLLLSQGVPMFVSGDEMRKTQKGNNNAYCQDNEISWIDWDLVDDNADMIRFAQALIQFRNEQPTLRRRTYLTGKPVKENGLPDVSWYSALGTAVDWDGDDNAIICVLNRPGPQDDPGQLGRDVLIMVNSTPEPREFIIPPVAKGTRWRLFVDTAIPSPGDVYPEYDGPPLPRSRRILLTYRSMRVYVAEK